MILKNWHLLNKEREKEYYLKIKSFYQNEINNGKTIFPPANQILRAFEETDFETLKVVIIGQDPYHGENQANGLCFSVNKGERIPPSLKNIFKEQEADLNIKNFLNGDLTYWAKQGVLMLNSVLTVEKDKAGSHSHVGWQTFTDQAIYIINEYKENIVFMLWGNYAISKSVLINGQKHKVLTAPHPSPFSVHKGFLGCKHFSQCNHFLVEKGLLPINWKLPEL